MRAPRRTGGREKLRASLPLCIPPHDAPRHRTVETLVPETEDDPSFFFPRASGAQFLKTDAGRWETVRSETYDAILFYSFVLLVPVATVATVISKLRHVVHLLELDSAASEHGNAERRHHAFRLQTLGLADDSDREVLRRYIEGWHVRKSFALFLSHYKNEASAEARVLKTELVRVMRAHDDQVFLDSDQLHDLRNLLQNVVDSDAVVLMNTRSVLSRPW